MSDNDKSGTAAPKVAADFNERELQMLGWAMQSVKSGLPEIDYHKLAAFAGMNNPRSAGNAWAKLKAKLTAGSDGVVVPATPKKGGAKKKATSKDDNDGETVDTPKRTPRKRPAKKQDVDGEASPKKKGAGKKVLSDETIKSESEDMQSNGSPVKGNPEDLEVEIEV
ncbi:Nn.00g058640.m01.CDS01 [Neocucurbitaria sp. VM-36]